MLRLETASFRFVDDATGRGQAAVDPAGLLLGIVEVEGMAARLLFDVGVPLNDIRGALLRAAS